MPPKRKASVKQEGKKQQKQDGQKAVSHDIDVPIDEGFHADGELPTISPIKIQAMDQSKVTHD